MSFRANLQHLRATRNMTQEQLAMLLGVSRQSVTKWEAERAYPEMDKLLKLCDIFNCTLDELVQGDLTARAPEPAASVPSSTPQDICGYDEHMRAFARKIPLGIAAVLVGVALCIFGVEASVLYHLPEGLGPVILLLFVGASLAVFIPAGMEHSAFVKEHPYVEDFYTAAEKADARRRLSTSVVVGILIIFAGVCTLIFTEGTAYENVSPGFLMLFIAVGVPVIVRAGMLHGRTNVAEYNKSAIDELETEDIVNAQIDEKYKQALLNKSKKSQRVNAVCGTIMIIATIVGLAMLFMPLAGQDLDALDAPVGTQSVFWMAWVVGGLLCGIAYTLMNAFGKDE